ncbi:MAG: DsbA family protein [Alphaproteobacteria bacterium]|nr:DsbA family protein [Alphaproteobacteria bacterium]
MSRSRLLVAALLLALALSAGARAQQSMPATGTMSPEQVQAIEKIVHDYLLRNPQVILDAVEQLEQARNDEAQAAAKTALAAHRDDVLHDPTSPVAGNPDGDVTIVEFFDYRCPYCKQVEPSLAQLRQDDRKLRFVYKEFPILGPDSVIASHAALAARKQNKYQQLHDALMAARGHLDEETIFTIAADAGLDVQRLKADMKSPDIESVISRNMALAHVLNINGTPGFIVGDQLVPGAVGLDDLKKIVAEARK